MITSRFEGHFLVEIECSDCEFETFNFETFAELNLDLANHDQNQRNILKMREKFKKSHVESRRNFPQATKQEKPRKESLHMRERRNSAVFDLEDSIFQQNADHEVYSSKKFLNKKSTIRKQVSSDEDGRAEEDRKIQEPGREKQKEEAKEQKQKENKLEPILLTELIEAFFSEEYIEDYNCSNCKKKTIIRKIYKIIKQPEILIISLKRFEFYPKIRKIKRSIIMGSPEVDLRKYIYSNLVSEQAGLTPNQVQSNVVDQKPQTFFSNKHIFAEDSDLDQNMYQLKAYIEHHGKMNKGHYVSFVKKTHDLEHEEWLLKNDDSVFTVVNHGNYLQEKNEAVYSMFYQMEKQRI